MFIYYLYVVLSNDKLVILTHRVESYLYLVYSPRDISEKKGPRWIFVNVSHQTRLETRSKVRRPIKFGIKEMGGEGTAHLVQCEPDEPNSFTNPNVGPGMYAG